jgi:hypothetical protein
MAMGKFRDILQQRIMGKEGPSNKAVALAERATTGQLTSFGGLFGNAQTTPAQREALEEILRRFAQDDANIEADLPILASLTGEIKAISNQAAYLHGERIKRAQELLIKYRDGAFTAWLLTAYGNRQTPYNFLQYFDFCQSLPGLRPQIDQMPRQAIYALASREGDLQRKEEIVRNYNGQSKDELLRSIRDLFPLDPTDRRQEDFGRKAFRTLSQLRSLFATRQTTLTSEQRSELLTLVDELRDAIKRA